ncbi:hypothetical protein MMC26_004686 [Xylographa opegraphella]|nr:hypothetical protein [Xylographa opegraphella]
MIDAAKEFSKEIFPDDNEQKRYLQWYREELVKAIEAKSIQPTVTSKDLWAVIQKTVWNNKASYWKFYDTATRITDPFALGTLVNGHGITTPLRLSIDLAALDVGYVQDIDTRLPWVVGGVLAIQQDLGNSSFDSILGVQEIKESEALFRFRSLGWVLMEQEIQDGGKHWTWTGHVLVLDLHRKLHPWLVLAQDWFEGDKGDAGETIKSQMSLGPGERYGPGILPGDTYWTPVGKLKGEFSGKIQYWFHKNAIFEVMRTGGRKQRLPLIMEWFLDDNGDEVAYRSQKKEHYRYRNGSVWLSLLSPLHGVSESSLLCSHDRV